MNETCTTIEKKEVNTQLVWPKRSPKPGRKPETDVADSEEKNDVPKGLVFHQSTFSDFKGAIQSTLNTYHARVRLLYSNVITVRMLLLSQSTVGFNPKALFHLP